MVNTSFDTETQEAVKALIAGSPTELEESFYKKFRVWYRWYAWCHGRGNNLINIY
jgi:hypothetical protein